MDKVEQLKEAIFNEFGKVELNEENLQKIERFIDKHVHENWVVLGSFHIKTAATEDGNLEILPDNLFTGVLLEKGRVKMDKLEEDRYDDEDAVWLWRNKQLFKCPKPAEYNKIIVNLNV